MRTGYLKMTEFFPSSVPVLSRKKSKKKGNLGQPLTKHHVGITLGEKECLPAKNYGKKIRNYFEKYHIGVIAVPIFFSGFDPANFDVF